MWSRTYGGTGPDEAYSVVQTVDGGYALAGHTYTYGAGDSDFWLVKVDALGVIPEFPSNIGLVVLMIIVTLTAVLMKKSSE